MTTVKRFGGRTRVSQVLRAGRRELDDLNAAFRASQCSKCGEVLELDNNKPFVSGGAVFVTCPHCSTVCHFGTTVLIPSEQRREHGTLVTAPAEDESVARVLSQAAGGPRSVDEAGGLGSGGTLPADRTYKRQIETVLGRRITWGEYNQSYRP